MSDKANRELAKLAASPSYNPTVHALLAVDFLGRFSLAVEYPPEWKVVEVRVADHSLANDVKATRHRQLFTMVAAGRHELGIYSAVRNRTKLLAGVTIDCAPGTRTLVTITPSQSHMSRPIEDATLVVTSLDEAP
jgi:hypothetical protein